MWLPFFAVNSSVRIQPMMPIDSPQHTGGRPKCSSDRSMERDAPSHHDSLQESIRRSRW